MSVLKYNKAIQEKIASTFLQIVVPIMFVGLTLTAVIHTLTGAMGRRIMVTLFALVQLH